MCDFRDQLSTDVTPDQLSLQKPTVSDCSLMAVLFFQMPDVRQEIVSIARTFTRTCGLGERQIQVDRIGELYNRARMRNYKPRGCLFAHEMTIALCFFSLAYCQEELSEIQKEWDVVDVEFKNPTSTTLMRHKRFISFINIVAFHWLDLYWVLRSDPDSARYDAASREAWPRTKFWDLTRIPTFDVEHNLVTCFTSFDPLDF